MSEGWSNSSIYFLKLTILNNLIQLTLSVSCIRLQEGDSKGR